jgi:hypothetical protein
MFCPKCGQPQSNDEVRFCVRCGLQLDGVKDLITLPVQNDSGNQRISKWQRQGVKTGAKIIFLSLILIPLFLAFGLIDKELLVLILVPKTIFLIGLFWMIYARIFGESPIQKKQSEIQTINSANLFSQHEQPKALPTQSINTAEIIQPASVTEHTTKIFEKR